MAEQIPVPLPADPGAPPPALIDVRIFIGDSFSLAL